MTDYGDLQFESFENDPARWNIRSPLSTGNATHRVCNVTHMVTLHIGYVT